MYCRCMVEKIWQGKTLMYQAFGEKVLQINRSVKRLIVSTSLDGFSLAQIMNYSQNFLTIQ